MLAHAGPATAQAFDATERPGAAREYDAGVAVGPVREQRTGAAGLRGVHVGFVAQALTRDQRPSFVGTWFVEWKDGGGQRTLEGGLGMSYPALTAGPFSVGPRARLAIVRRSGVGDGVFVAARAGAEAAWWTPRRRVQMVVQADPFGSTAPGSRGMIAAHVRVMLWHD